MQETRGIIMFNRGDQCIVRAMVCLYTLRKYWDGPVTFYLETPYPKEFDEACKYFNVDIVHNEEKHEYRTLIRKTDMFANPPYDRTLWLDADMLILGKLDEMFDYLDDSDVSIPHFCKWVSNGNKIAARIKKFEGIADKKYLNEALNSHPAVNTGILSFRKSAKWTRFVNDWVALAHKGNKIFISDEVAFQILYPSASEWGLKVHISPPNFNVSVLYGNEIEDKRVIHYHGRKHVLDVPLCDVWKSTFKEMCDNNVANINYYLKYADKRLKEYLKNKDGITSTAKSITSDVSIVTAIDEKYLPILQVTYPNWRKYKNIDNHPVVIFVYGLDIENDPRLDFLRLSNVTMVKWDESCLDASVDSHRELMLSAFVFGVADYVKTDYWIKLDADSYATNNSPLYNEDFKKYSVYSHKWGYSRPSHIEALDAWAKTHWHKKLKDSQPMIEQGKVDGNRFYHNGKRFISYVCFQRTRFTRYCVKLLDGKRRLPAPTQDTYAYFLIQKLKPEEMGIGNFKKDHGFTQGNGKLGAEHIKKCIENIELQKEQELDSDYKDEDKESNNDKSKTTESIKVLDNQVINYIDKVINSSLGEKNLDYLVEIKEK